MLSIDQYAYSSALKDVHPVEKFIFAISLLLICLLADSLVISVIVIALAAIATVGMARIPGSYYAKMLLMPLAFLLPGVLTVMLSFGDRAAGYWQEINLGAVIIGVRYRDMVLAVNLFFKSLGAVSCLYFLVLTTPMVDLIWVLKKLKTPGLFLELMGLIYRFIFVLLDTAGRMYISQATRLGYASWRNSYHSLGGLVVNLFGKSLQKSRELTVTMMARCYTDAINVLDNEYVLSKRNLAVIGFIDLAMVLLALYLGGGLAWLI
ncbi:cobalt ECF transporter T component CbiQ [Zhaonella formicivorans]|uniref:cobalt ECF transporter T component CbiQ n=1 Tax=Zhaonella formicivorans TaxID=2528593 RepID=UPI0010E9046A|nr:cobalt ECF transporter T component CbiQ [Zhaonella formicivorans]